jgi:hypothetical protein
LYTRPVAKAPDTLIKNGKPVFGTFFAAPEHLDIRGVRRPFASIPLPPFVTNSAIRSNLTCMFNSGRFICSAEFFGMFLFGFVEIVFWDMELRKKNAYRTLIGPRVHFIPYALQKGVSATFNRRRKLKIAWNRKKNSLTFMCRLKGDALRPDIQGAFTANLAAAPFSEVTCVLPAPVMRRCRAVYRFTAAIKGAFTVAARGKNGGQKETHSFSEGNMLFDMHRAYYKIRTKNEYAFGIGKADGQSIAFSIVSSSLEAANPDEYNENFLFVDGIPTLLPPVKITYPFGVAGKWIIQDTESMIDLSFSPVLSHSRTHSLFVLSTRYHLIFGTYNGVLLTRDGQQVVLRDFPGIVKKHVFRL